MQRPAQTIRTVKLPAARADRWERALAELHRIDLRVARNGKSGGASNDMHHANLAKAKRRAALAEREAALWRATAEVLRWIGRFGASRHAGAPPWAALAAITTARFVFSAPT